MLGAIINKENFNQEDYISCSNWCSENNATIEDKGEYYEVVAIPAPPPPTIDEIKQGLIATVQNHMDTQAQARGYDNIASACSYGLSTVEKFRNEAIACIAWRDNVWNYCYEQLALFEAGQREIPTDIISELPTLEW